MKTIFFLNSVEGLRVSGASGAFEARFETEALYHGKLALFDRSQVSEVLQKRTKDGMTQTLYRKAGDGWQYYFYLTIGGVSYDLGYNVSTGMASLPSRRWINGLLDCRQLKRGKGR